MRPSFPSSSSPLSLAEMGSKGGGGSSSTPTPSNPPPKTHLHHHHKLQQQQEQGKSEEKLGTTATVTTTTTTTTTTNTNNTTATSSSDSAKRLTRNVDADADASVSVLASVSPKRARKGRSSASSQPQQLPSCQVEGCEADLSSAKEYHRRHKVCQMHSKSAKVMVAGIGQRFCQQCSRFHVLMEFDESKRSCRRRLAGHNERRRKPKTDPMAMRFAAFQDDRHFSQILLQQHLLHYPRMPSFPACWDGSEQSKLQYCMNPLTMLNPAPLYDYMGMERPMLYSGAPPLMAENINKPLFRFLQNPKGMMMPMQDEITTTTTQKGGYQYNMDGHGLSLFSTLGATTATTTPTATSSQGIISTAAEISDSRRALSLLSSQPWSSNASAVVAPTMSLELSPRLDMAIDRFIIHGNGSGQPNQLNQLNDPNQPNQPNQPSLSGPFMQFSSSASDQMLSIPMMEKEQCSVGGGFEEAPLPPPQLPILSVMQDQVGACDVQQDKRAVTASIDLGHLLHGSSHGFHLGPDSDDYNSLQALRCGVSMFDSHQLI